MASSPTMVIFPYDEKPLVKFLMKQRTDIVWFRLYEVPRIGEFTETDSRLEVIKGWGIGFPGGSVVKNPPANAGDVGSIRGQEDPLEKEMASSSSVLVWEIPWTEKPGGL